jgi:hypothetical protein
VVTGTLRYMSWWLWIFVSLGAAEIIGAAWLHLRHLHHEKHHRAQVVTANQRVIFPACSRMHARRMAEDWPGTVSFLSRRLDHGFAWYSVRSTAAGETITRTGWCRTRRGCDRVRTRIRSAASADVRSAATRLPAA